MEARFLWGLLAMTDHLTPDTILSPPWPRFDLVRFDDAARGAWWKSRALAETALIKAGFSTRSANGIINHLEGTNQPITLRAIAAIPGKDWLKANQIGIVAVKQMAGVLKTYGLIDDSWIPRKGPTYDQLVAQLAASEADADRLAEAVAGNGAWLERWAAHVGACVGGDQCTCGLTFALHENHQALAAHEARKETK